MTVSRYGENKGIYFAYRNFLLNVKRLFAKLHKYNPDSLKTIFQSKQLEEMGIIVLKQACVQECKI